MDSGDESHDRGDHDSCNRRGVGDSGRVCELRSDGGAQSHSITVPSSAAKLHGELHDAIFSDHVGGNRGTISPASEWVNGGSSVQISATANSGYQFSGFTGAVNATTSPASFTVNAPAAVTANFSSGAVAITVTTLPSGMAFAADGTTYSGSQVFQWTPGTSHTIAVTTGVCNRRGRGLRTPYASWSDGGAQSHSITVPSSAASYTANFTTQYFLTHVGEERGERSVRQASG